MVTSQASSVGYSNVVKYVPFVHVLLKMNNKDNCLYCHYMKQVFPTENLLIVVFRYLNRPPEKTEKIVGYRVKSPTKPTIKSSGL